MPHIGVIIPVYNVEKYLNQCVDSVLNQSYKDIEIILVNDGSTDNSGKICDQYKLKDDRILVIHKENGGLSDARNNGIRLSTAEYLLFLDSDDFWMDQSLKEIAECTVNKPDLVFLTAAKLYDKTNTMENTFESLKREEVFGKSPEEVFKYLASEQKFPVSACTKLIKRDLIIENDLFFQKGLLSEDIDWSTRLLLVAEKFDVCDVDFYVYRKQRNESITGSIRLKNVEDMMYIIKKWLKKCENGEVKSELSNHLLALLAYEYTILMGHMYSISKVERSSVLKEVKSLKILLNYSYNKKTEIVRRLEKIIGFNNVSYLLNLYIKSKT